MIFFPSFISVFLRHYRNLFLCENKLCRVGSKCITSLVWTWIRDVNTAFSANCKYILKSWDVLGRKRRRSSEKRLLWADLEAPRSLQISYQIKSDVFTRYTTIESYHNFSSFFRSQAKNSTIFSHNRCILLGSASPCVSNNRGSKEVVCTSGALQKYIKLCLHVEYISNTVDTLIEYKSFFCGIATAQKSS